MSRTKVFVIVSSCVACGVLLAWKSVERKATDSVSRTLARHEAELEEKIQNQAGSPSRTIASTTRSQKLDDVPNPPPNQNLASVGGGRATEGLLRLLEKYSGTPTWTINRDDDGRPFRMTGGILRDVMREDAKADAFLSDLQSELGFSSPAVLQRSVERTASFEVVDYAQLYELSDGTRVPVFDGWIRFKGRVDSGAFIVTNQLRPVSLHIRAESKLSEQEAIEIVREYLGETSGRLTVRHTVVFASEEPHQTASLVWLREGMKERLLVVGHQTRTVVANLAVSLQ